MSAGNETCNLCASLSARATALSVVFALIVAAAPTAQAQTYQVIHYFQSGTDGASPAAGVIIDRAGNLYGTTYNIFGTAFQVRALGSGWILAPLIDLGFEKGSAPSGDDHQGRRWSFVRHDLRRRRKLLLRCGLQPAAAANFPTSAFSSWTETIVYEFTGQSDGGFPGYGALVFGQAGNLYGTTTKGGAYGLGAVFKLTPSQNGWTESVIDSFGGFPDGSAPYSGVIFDSAGNLYGTTTAGGQYAKGTVFELTPQGRAGPRLFSIPFSRRKEPTPRRLEALTPPAISMARQNLEAWEDTTGRSLSCRRLVADGTSRCCISSISPKGRESIPSAG